MTSPMQLTLKELKKRKLLYGIVERYFPKSKKYPFGHKEDFLNIIDLIALDNGTVGIQICGGGGDFMKHVRKITEEYKSNTVEWLKNRNRFELWAWRKVKVKRGGKAMIWKPRIADILLVKGELYLEERSN